MKKIFLLLVSVLLTGAATNAQYVNIADANFRTFLQQQYPGCFNNNGLMDTTCAAVLTEDILTLPPLGNTIQTLDGIQYFKSLQSLNCSYANVVYIPSLPSSLKNLACQRNPLTSWPTLPPLLETFSCSECSLTSVPTLPLSLTWLDCSKNSTLATLPTLPSSLKTLNCSGCQLTSLPALPSSLITLNCSNNPVLSALPALPSSVQFADISDCSILALPAPLSAGLKELDCSNNDLTSLTAALPNGLERLNCRGNGITSLPALPSALTYMECGYNRLTALPVLPQSLKTLYCYTNLLTALPALPAGLNDLWCGGNQFGSYLSTIGLPDSLHSFYCEGGNITALPLHLPSSLESLHCGANQLTQLPALPASLLYLNCSNNQLTSLPGLPTVLKELNCDMNNIYCLPVLPDSFSSNPFYMGLQVTFDAEKIKCIPNRPGRLRLTGNNHNTGGIVTNLPLCNPANNASQCQAFPVIAGVVFYDNNRNGVRDAGEAYKSNMAMSLSNGNITYTNKDGYFETGVDSLRNYTITGTPPSCFNLLPASNTYTFTSNDTLVTSNYALQANTTIDSLSIRIIPLNWAARPGFDFLYLVSYQNLGTTTLSPNVVFHFDDTRLIYDSCSNAAVTHTGNNLSLATGSLTPGNEGTFVGYFRLFPTVSLSDTLLTSATITAAAYSSGTTSIVSVRGSFDPNDKQATPQLSPSQVANGQYIDYTIRFQNTGTDTAFTIVISDTLSDDLQTNTLQMIASSHNCKTTVKDNIVFFEFLNILLPDSNTNEPLSHGFVSFKIKPQTTVAVNTTIPNSAAIYFDYNAPVITNTAGTLIKDLIVLPLKLISFNAVPQNENTTSLYWNTSNEINTHHFVVEKSNDGLAFNSIKIVIATGRANNNYNAVVADANTGIVFYRLKIIDKDGSFVYSPVLKIDRRKNAAGFTILSNPVRDLIIIHTTGRTLHNTNASIINMQGVVVKTFYLKEGTQTVVINDLPSGVYYIRTINGSNRFLKQ
jgi:uncharacterized repeat protein (TIGR01451 family)